MKIGIFGGSFNPVHLGHFEIVRQGLTHRCVDQMIVVPAYQNPLKESQKLIPESVRMQMIEKTFAPLTDVTISDFESNRKGVSYTYKTLEYFHNLFPTDELILILGEDSFGLLDQWAEVETVLRLARLLIFKRPEQTISQPPFRSGGKKSHVTYTDLEIPAISSTMIRQQLQRKKDCSSWIHPDALDIWQNYEKKIRNPLHKKTSTR